jgi:hypothetical protein
LEIDVKVKLKWKASEKPTGPYKCFQKRSWPVAHFGKTDVTAASIYCEDQYVPSRVKLGEHKELIVRVAIRDAEKGPGWNWCNLKKRAATLEEAKAIAQDFFDRNPKYLPEEFK